MTREEAITVLKVFMENPLFSDDHKQAFNMAIKALEQMPCEYEELDFVQPHKKIPVNLVPCKEENKWIPVSEEV